MASHGVSSSSSFDVFLNFRGEDTRDNFVAHLRGALKEKEFNIFIDDGLKKGEKIGPELFEAIERSKMSIVVFSQDYASSSWCLNELLKIVECKEKKKQKVLPVFYKVDPSHVRHQTDRVGEALANHKAKFEEKHRAKFDDKMVDKWKKALTEVANLSGFYYKEGNEFEFIRNTIVQEVFQILQFPYLDVAKNEVGIESRVEDFKKCLDIRKKKNIPCMVGIWGAAGIGKTTIAKAIYNSIGRDFEVTCFLERVRECTTKDGSKTLPTKDGLTKLQNTILSKISRDESLRSDNVDEGIAKLQRILPSKKILLILDDVNRLEQLKTLAGNGDWFGLDSVIIITTRDKSLYTSHKENFEEHFLYKVEKLNCNEALQLFSMYAFKTNKLDSEYLELAKQAIDYARGLPLALTLLGSTLYGNKIDDKKKMLKACIRNPCEPIPTILKFSYNDLDKELKAVFLDIACFFKGMDIGYVEEILTDCDYDSIELHIKQLEDKSLIKIGQFSKLEMHDLVQEMGRQIVQEESFEAGERSRLWLYEDICHVLEENTGTNKVRGIVVDFPKGGEIDLDPEAFKEMKNLRLLIVRNGRFSQTPNILPCELRVLEWANYPGESLPPKFRGKKLAVLKVPESKLTGLKRKNFENLRTLNLEGSELLEVPNLSWAPNLVSIDLSRCKRLKKVDDSVGTLEKLSWFILEGCRELKFFPRSLESRSLERLDLRKCPLISACPEIKSEKVDWLGLGETSIEELFPSFRNLIGLKSLSLSVCQKYLQVEENKECGTSIDSPEVSEMSSGAELLKLPTQTESSACNHENCFLSKFFRSTTSGPAFTLRFLYLCRNNMVSLPECIQYLVLLIELSLYDCEQLKEISVVPLNLQDLQVAGCKSLQRIHFNADAFPKKLWIGANDCNSLSEGIWEDLRDLLVNGRRPDFYALNIQLYEMEIPPWFSCFELPGLTSCTLVIKEPTHLKSEIKGIAFCAVLGECPDPKSGKTWAYAPVRGCQVSVTSLSSRVYSAQNLFGPMEGSKLTILRCHISESFKQKLEGKGINIKVGFYCDDCFIFNCGVHLIYGHEQNAADQANIWRIDGEFNFEDYGDDEFNFEEYEDDANDDSNDDVNDDDDESDDSNDDVNEDDFEFDRSDDDFDHEF